MKFDPITLYRWQLETPHGLSSYRCKSENASVSDGSESDWVAIGTALRTAKISRLLHGKQFIKTTLCWSLLLMMKNQGRIHELSIYTEDNTARKTTIKGERKYVVKNDHDQRFLNIDLTCSKIANLRIL